LDLLQVLFFLECKTTFTADAECFFFGLFLLSFSAVSCAPQWTCMQSHLGFVEGPSLPVRLSAAAGILFQVNAAWLVWQFLKHKAPDVVHFKTPAYY
jgi:hypothetical protein